MFESRTIYSSFALDSSSLDQKPFWRTNKIDNIIEEDNHMKNQFKVQKLPDPIYSTEAASKFLVEFMFNDPNMIRNTAHVDLNE